MKRELLRQLREASGNRPEIAPKLGISVIHLRKLENGDVNPSATLMFKMSKFFCRAPEELFPDVIDSIN
ncbi:helix-turn-helix transcriptional regulator [Brevibacillus invocatus]|uniref:helix-turn-helix transcriptional regulator n=1 Tax=Brevibacillus invocatus TaxID=173959 RepID=UPI00203DFE5C|nr:helix-turn-helix transcriptional regulator [Brevibacillus invocatus]MCM3079601.1 helix-turn-helix transcriptional regulator [Brevibacillus invocatus]MCM3429799.1 helix-turn-helix transcriptional regulator [Brevibacillus invocatus]